MINTKKVLKKLEESAKSGRGRVSLYLDKELYRKFSEACGKVSASRVVEELMRVFLEENVSRR